MAMNGSFKSKTRADKRKRELPTFFARPLQLIADQTGLSLTSALRQKNKKPQTRRKGASNPSQKKQSSNTFSTPLSLDTHLRDVLLLSNERDDSDGDSDTSATNTPTSFESLDQDFHPSQNDVDSYSPLSDIHAEELFLSTLVHTKIQHKTVTFDLTTSPDDQVFVDIEEEGQQEVEEATQSLPLQLSVTPPKCVDCRVLETILEVANEDDTGSVWSSVSSDTEFQVSFFPTDELFLRTLAIERATVMSKSKLIDDYEDDTASVFSSASSHTEFEVSFSPTNEFFLQTLAMERAIVLSNSERSNNAESINEDACDKSILTVKTFLEGRDFSANRRLGFLILVLLLLMGTSEHIIQSLETVSIQLWMTLLLLLQHDLTSDTQTILYNIRNEAMGVWLR
ncbi:hypothetical protein IV203_015196 [Nitzschia inconspicua]|uniref:Uncharacterized protein n=1 Tax=Nitzschia inconspicua TaxID=303405 RepID=A0A9K3LAP8_9STRA|nr:hypothetical protein IV203_015196 [Nitzschia inconspicua]